MEREILFLKVPSFPVTLEKLRDPSLGGKPVAICAPGSGRNLLLGVSAEARKEGLSKGMLRQQALRACPGLRLLPPDPELYRKAAGSLFCFLSNHSPLVEPIRPGSLFLDLSGTGRLFGPARDLAGTIRKELRQRFALAVGLGLATSKLVSRIAVKAAPGSDLCDVFPGGERHFLEPLDVDVLPAVRPVPTAQRLRELNIEKVGDLVAVPMPALRIAFGQAGLALFRQARALDASPVRAPSRRPRVTAEETLPEESNEDVFLFSVLQGLAEDAGNRLRTMKTEAGRIELEAQYADGVTACRASRIRPPALLDRSLFRAARNLLEQTVQRRVRLRRITLHCLELIPLSGQVELFPEEALFPPAVLRQKALQESLDKIRSRFGKGAIRWGSRETA